MYIKTIKTDTLNEYIYTHTQFIYIFFSAVAPSEHKARPFRRAPEPLVSPPKSPFNKEEHSPASSPSTTFYKHHHTRNTITSPAPASSYLLSPRTSKHQGLVC